MNNVFAGLMGTQALDEENNSFMVVGFDLETTYVYLVDANGNSYSYEFSELRFPEMGLMVKPAPLQAVENEEESEEKSNGWFT